MPKHDVFDDGEPQPGATFLPTGGWIDAVKPLDQTG